MDKQNAIIIIRRKIIKLFLFKNKEDDIDEGE